MNQIKQSNLKKKKNSNKIRLGFVYLISKNSNRAGAGNLIGTKPNSGQTSWNAKNKNLRTSHDGLTDESNVKFVWVDGGHLYPGPETSSSRPQKASRPQSLQLQSTN